jgi:hypothetical protein
LTLPKKPHSRQFAKALFIRLLFGILSRRKNTCFVRTTDGGGNYSQMPPGHTWWSPAFAVGEIIKRMPNPTRNCGTKFCGARLRSCINGRKAYLALIDSFD